MAIKGCCKHSPMGEALAVRDRTGLSRCFASEQQSNCIAITCDSNSVNDPYLPLTLPTLSDDAVNRFT